MTADENAKVTLSELEHYKEEGAKGAIIGISGGKDSTVAAMLCKKVFGKNVLGVLMPNGLQTDIDDSYAIVKKLDIDYTVVNITDAYLGLLDSIDQKYNITAKAKTNIPPRIRMTILYAIGQTLGYRVIGTGNASEGYIGWCTKWGDMACDYNPLCKLTCTEVIEVGKVLAKEFGLDEKYIVKTPSDGLCGHSDEDSFGFTYAQLDKYIQTGTSGNAEIDTKIKNMHDSTEHKRHLPSDRKL